jgi:hypothetical protein
MRVNRASDSFATNVQILTEQQIVRRVLKKKKGAAQGRTSGNKRKTLRSEGNWCREQDSNLHALRR